MAELKTKANDGDVKAFLESIEDATRRGDALAVCDLMSEVTGDDPVMWGPAIVGFGSQRLRYASGRELDWMKIGFSPRKQNVTIYLTQGFEALDEALARLGPHKLGKGCLYLKRLADVDTDVLAEIIKSSYAQAS